MNKVRRSKAKIKVWKKEIKTLLELANNLELQILLNRINNNSQFISASALDDILPEPVRVAPRWNHHWTVDTILVVHLESTV